MDGIMELAKLLKERENPSTSGIQVGKVVVGFPDIKISAGDKIILDRDDLVFSAHILKNYRRDFEIENIDGETDSINVGDHGTHKHKINTLKATIKFTDELKIGDEVILIPTTDEQTYYVLDKVVRL